jgi:hypothetical protein
MTNPASWYTLRLSNGEITMNTEESFDYFVDLLEHEETGQIGLTLVIIARIPSGDPRMLTYLEGYLEDTRPTMISVAPEYYTEVRYAAGQALAAERGVQGIKEGVSIPASVIPLTWTEMRHLAREAGLNVNLLPLKLLPTLMEKELAPRRHHAFPPRIPKSWLNKVDKPD